MLCMCHMSILIHSVKKMEATMQAKSTRASGNVMYIFYTMLLSGVVMVVLYWMICRFLSRTSQSSHRERRNSSKNTSTQKKSISSAVSSYMTSKQEKSKRRTTSVKSKKKEFTHSWKITALKGHTGHIVDMSISNNGKYIGSCAEGSACEHHDERPGKQSFQRSKIGVNLERNGIRRTNYIQLHPASNLNVLTLQLRNTISEPFKENGQSQGVYPLLCPCASYSKPVAVQFYCRNKIDPSERKPMEGVHFPTFQFMSSVPLAAGIMAGHTLKQNNCLSAVNSPDYECERLKIKQKDSAIAHMMMLHYMLPPQNMKDYGYPQFLFDHVEIEFKPYPKNTSASSNSGIGPSLTQHFDQKQESLFDIAKTSSDKSSESKKSDELPTNKPVLRKILCARCEKPFYIDENNKYEDEECCFYHWGKLHTYSTGVYWTCCNKQEFDEPCATAKMHVWTGLVPGCNGPYTDFMRTPNPSKESPDSYYGVYGLDCEMCFTRNGLELTRVSLVDMYGEIVYDTLVKPEAEIIDYNSRFSGITEKDLKNVTKTLGDVQNDLLKFINNNTILVGHALESDLRVLRLVHIKIVDTSILFADATLSSPPHRRSLKTMAYRVLKRSIQESVHDSVEDSRAAMDLVMRKLQHDFSKYETGNVLNIPSSKEREMLLEIEKKKSVQKDMQDVVKMRAEGDAK